MALPYRWLESSGNLSEAICEIWSAGMKDVIQTVIKADTRLKNASHPDIYDFSETSESATYYDDFFSANPKTLQRPERYAQIKDPQHPERRKTLDQIAQIVTLLKKHLPPEAIVVEIGGGVHQQRGGNLYQEFPHYFPLDISFSSIKRYVEKFNRPGIVANAEKLPFKDQSIDCIFTHTFLEHPLHPERVVSEIARIIKPGGLVVHKDAWFCRWWQRFGVVGLKHVKNMTWKERMIYTTSRVTEFPLVKYPPVILNRAFKEVFLPPQNPLPLCYKKLKPNYKLSLGCDEDAASSIDPFDVIRFYESRGFHLLEPLSRRERIGFRKRYVAMIRDEFH